MKKTLLLSVVASTMIMAGGDIAPVEPVVEAPVVEASGWDFSGQAVVYYQTVDTLDILQNGEADLFEQTSSLANVGLQLRAVNKDLFAGIGAGVEVSGLGTWGLEEDVVANVMQGPFKGGWISQAYLTYAMGNTTVKLGRQELPKALSPFAFSEGWNVFKNTFDAGLLVNTDITDTTLVGAVVFKSNGNGIANDMSAFSSINPDGSGDDEPVFMLTAQNKSIDGLTLTGTYYNTGATEAIGNEDLSILWADAKFKVSNFDVAVQGGTVMSDALSDDAVAFGAKAGATFGIFNASVAYSSTDENFPIHNLGTGVKTPLYTQMILNQGVIKIDTDYLKAGVSADVLGGKLIANYGYALEYRDGYGNDNGNNPSELDLIFKTKVFNDSTTLLAAYVMVDSDTDADNTNAIRVWGRYNF